MKNILFLSTFLFTSFAYGVDVSKIDPPAAVKSSSQRTYVLPINWAETPKYGLVVTIPQGFKPLVPQGELDASATLQEYIPENETAENWTEIISVSKYIGKSIGAIKLLGEIKTQMLAKATNGKVWIESNAVKPNYQQASLGIQYDYQGKHEVMGAHYYSGPYDCVGVQYTIRPTLNIPDDDVAKIIDSFFKTNMQVVAFTPA